MPAEVDPLPPLLPSLTALADAAERPRCDVLDPQTELGAYFVERGPLKTGGDNLTADGTAALARDGRKASWPMPVRGA